MPLYFSDGSAINPFTTLEGRLRATKMEAYSPTTFCFIIHPIHVGWHFYKSFQIREHKVLTPVTTL